jgi:hypothetical protein
MHARAIKCIWKLGDLNRLKRSLKGKKKKRRKGIKEGVIWKEDH